MARYRLKKGYTHVITGDGPGKTTAAIGLAVRALGNGLKVCIVQFMKNQNKGITYGEINFFKGSKNIDIKQFGTGSFIKGRLCSPVDARLAEQGLEFASEKIFSGKYDVVILDEVNIALDFGLIDLEKVMSLVRLKPDNLELILTGRNAPKELYQVADYVVSINSIKHPYDNGVEARKGIEY
ncbi:MAG: cob(I)yrinic acid a,c-diamide adenosyltransferase [Nitrososphaeria archaeon]